MTVIVNTSPLVALDRIGQLDILPTAAHKKGHLPDLQGAVSELKASGFQISDSVIAAILKITG